MFRGMRLLWEDVVKYREAVVWGILATAFLLPCLYYYHKDNVSVLQMDLVSENQVIQAGAEQAQLQLYAKAAVLMDADSQRVLYGKNENEILPMASTTKIMTCIIAIESGSMDELAQVSSYAAGQPRVNAGLKSGEQYYIRDLLYSLMLESHNDTAVVIAEHIGGSVEGFAEMMNQKAQELGMENSYFITPNGLDATKGELQHSTTAHDLAVLSADAIQNETFVAIVNTGSYTFYDTQQRHAISLNNKNAFLTQMDGAIGIKTGFTGNAGYCFTGAVRREDTTLVSVVLASGWPPNKSYKWADTANLMQYGWGNYEIRSIYLPASERIVIEMEGQQAHHVTTQRMELEELLSDTEEIVMTDLFANNVQGTIPAQTVAGIRTVFINRVPWAQSYYFFEEPIETTQYKQCFDGIVQQFLL